jgi:hypothetical protein
LFNQLAGAMWGWRRSDEAGLGLNELDAADLAGCPMHGAEQADRSCPVEGFVIHAPLAERMGIQPAGD